MASLMSDLTMYLVGSLSWSAFWLFVGYLATWLVMILGGYR